MNRRERLQRVGELPFTKLEGQLLVVVAKTREVHLLNEPAARIWELLEHSETIDGLMAALSEEYDLDPVAGAEEVEAVLAEMKDKGLVKDLPE